MNARTLFMYSTFWCADGDYVKPKRGFNGVSGLTPFPRTGRSDPDLFNWDNINGNHLNNEAYGSIEEYEGKAHRTRTIAPLQIYINTRNAFGFVRASNTIADYPHMEVKRQGLIPFPRVGRSGASRYMSKAAMMQGMKRGVPGSGNAMWFGPRLGRIQKRGSPSAAANQGDLL